jgi:hypothetical protein
VQQTYRIEIVIDGKRRGIVLEELSRIQRPAWNGEDYYTPAARAVWDALAAMPCITMVTPKPG